MDGIGKNRRMPVQQSMDVAVPVETAYNQFTQFEDWTEFMHRVTRVTQEDETNVSFATKIWTRTREFKAEIITQRPNERIKWSVSEGITHTGVVTFHELAPRLTRIELNMDVEPGGIIEKAARGMRHIKRAARADLHRFKAYIEMEEQETGAWRGVIEDGELVEDHDPSYDEEREFGEAQAASDDESAPDETADEPDEDAQEPEAEAEPKNEVEEGEEPEAEEDVEEGDEGEAEGEEEPEADAQEDEEEPEAEGEEGDEPEASEQEAVDEGEAEDSPRQRTPRFQRDTRAPSSARGRSRGSNSGGGSSRGRRQRSAGRH